MNQTLLKAAEEEGIFIAPRHLVYLALGGVQPPLLYVKKADSAFWNSRLLEAEAKLDAIEKNDPDCLDTPLTTIAGLTNFISVAAQISFDLAQNETPFSGNGAGKFVSAHQKELKQFRKLEPGSIRSMEVDAKLTRKATRRLAAEARLEANREASSRVIFDTDMLMEKGFEDEVVDLANPSFLNGKGEIKLDY